MSYSALKEWAVTCAALAAGDQIVILRKGGIGEKRFSLPHSSFFLFPTYAHQRADLVHGDAAERFGAALNRRDDPTHLPLDLWATITDSYEITDVDALTAIESAQILTSDYAMERLKWRRTQPLWAVILRISQLTDPPVLHVGPEHGGCVSWLDLPDEISLPTHTPVLDDAAFQAASSDIADRLAPFVTAR